MDYLTIDFYYKGKESFERFRKENISDKLDKVTLWSGYVEFNNERRYFHKLWFWYIARDIMRILDEREIFIKISLHCKTRIYYEELS